MKNYFQLTTLALLVFNSLTFSQKLVNPENITEKHFALNNTNNHIVIQYDNLLTFPYYNDKSIEGALDKYFTFKIESFLRVFLKKGDLSTLLILPKSFENGVKIKSAKYFYLKENSITNRKLKDSDISIVLNENGYFLDFSKIIQDSCAILDISLSSVSKNKQNLILLKDKNKTYKSITVQVYIPQIYSYENTFEPCLSSQIKKDLKGPLIGYDNGVNGKLLGEALAETFSKGSGYKYRPVYCKIDNYSFYNSSTCQEINQNYAEIINFTLTKINEITTADTEYTTTGL